MTTLELSDTEAKLFLEYQKHHDLFLTLEAVGAFNVQYGKVIMNCAAGQVQNIVLEQIAWKR